MSDFVLLDLAPLVTITCAAGLLALLGAFLVLQKRAMLGDAMAHSVLPGLAVAFILTGARAPVPMFIGALVSSLAAALISHAIVRYGRTDPSAAIGVVFTTLFALGVALIEATDARNVDLDLDCVLSGQLELLFWAPPEGAGALQLAASLPRETRTLFVLGLLVPSLVIWFWHPLRAALFDRSFAVVAGARPGVVQAALLCATTLVLVASFEALGSILVISLLTCPAAAARLVTERLVTYVACAAAFGVLASIAGYFAATRLAPLALGHSVDASGAVAATAGAILLAVALARGGAAQSVTR